MRNASAQNVLYILVDDLRSEFGFTHPSSSHAHHTPHIDAFARESTFFAKTFSQVAFCVPSRSSFLTGLRPETTGSVHNDQMSIPRIRSNRHAPLCPGCTVLDYFKRAGYHTAAVGKIFHFGEEHPALDLPVITSTHDLLRRPCDELRSSAKDMRAPHSKTQFGFPQACALPFGSFVDERVAFHAAKYLRVLSNKSCCGDQRAFSESKQPARPFLLMVGFSRPHNPYQFPSRHLDALPPANATEVAAVRWRHVSQPAIAFADDFNCTRVKCSGEQRRFYRGAVSHLDEMVGALLGSLRRLALENKTLVALHADHATSLGENGAWEKRTLFDHASRVPLFIRDPWHPAARGRHVTDALVELVDVLPTLLELSGANQRVPPPSSLQGRSLLPLLEKQQPGHFRYAFTIAPRLLHATRPGRRGEQSGHDAAEKRKVVLDGHASADLFFNGNDTASRVENLQCSDDLASSPFGPLGKAGRPCRFVAMGFSVRSQAWRYTRWERWPLPTAPNRVWTVGEGGLLAEELYQYNTTDELADAGSGQSEEINLLYNAAAQQNVQSVKAELLAALLSRRPDFSVVGATGYCSERIGSTCTYKLSDLR